jgi:hypothetical protein
MPTDTSERFKDVLFALKSASEFKQDLGRLRLQKLIYLSDVLSVAWRKMSDPPGFIPYKNGPYDQRIQNAVDALAFRGLVTATSLSFRQPRITDTTYALTPEGQDTVDKLCEDDAFSEELTLFREIATEVNRRGWSKIKKLVYAEPTYEFARSTNRYGLLRMDSVSRNLSLRILRDFEDAFASERAEPISRRNFIQLFFAFLDEYGGAEADDPDVWT